MVSGEKFMDLNFKYMNKENLSIIRQSFASTVFTHKVQEVAAENQENNVFTIKVVNIVLVSIVLILLIIQTAKPEVPLFSYIGAGITIAEVIFLIIQLTFSFEQRVVMHKNSALKYMGLRDAYRSLIADVMSDSISADRIIAQRDLLQREYQVISDLAPQTGPKEYTEAQKRLNKRGEVQGEEFTWSDDEIDWFLPESLRLKKHEK
jgi:hypothetical protein